jgi:hypothetical protein
MQRRVTGIGGIFFKAKDPSGCTSGTSGTWVLFEDYDYGRFAWIMDPEGNRIELWQPLP